jgi:hypothetical protein
VYPRGDRQARLWLVAFVLVMSSPVLLIPDSAFAEEECRPWGSTDPGVCGENEPLAAVGGVGHGSDTHLHCYAAVLEQFYWGRGYNNRGGWHVEFTYRVPEGPPNTQYCLDPEPSTVIWAGFRLYQGGPYVCSQPNILCYVTTKWSFENPGSRLFYTSDDGAHSTVQCWNSDPANDCAY